MKHPTVAAVAELVRQNEDLKRTMYVVWRKLVREDAYFRDRIKLYAALKRAGVIK